jgi:hypothetical protein
MSPRSYRGADFSVFHLAALSYVLSDEGIFTLFCFLCTASAAAASRRSVDAFAPSSLRAAYATDFVRLRHIRAFCGAYRDFYGAALWFHFLRSWTLGIPVSSSLCLIQLDAQVHARKVYRRSLAVTCDAVSQLFCAHIEHGLMHVRDSWSRRVCLLFRVNLGALALCYSCQLYCFRARGGCAAVCPLSYGALRSVLSSKTFPISDECGDLSAVAFVLAYFLLVHAYIVERLSDRDDKQEPIVTEWSARR